MWSGSISRLIRSAPHLRRKRAGGREPGSWLPRESQLPGPFGRAVQEPRRGACAVRRSAATLPQQAALVVVGGGDSAVEEAEYWSKSASTAYMIHRRDQLRASKIMAQRAMANLKIKILWNRGTTRQAPEAEGVTWRSAEEHGPRARPRLARSPGSSWRSATRRTPRSFTGPWN